MNIENNIILNEFVGLRPKLESPDVYTFAKMPFFSCRHYTPEEVIKSIAEYTKYDQDWNLIMDVVKKIQLLDIVHDNTRNYDNVFKEWQCTFSPSYKTHDFGYIVGKSKNSEIEAVYNACVEFVKWYNQQK
jgi:hypothetical protein